MALASMHKVHMMMAVVGLSVGLYWRTAQVLQESRNSKTGRQGWLGCREGVDHAVLPRSSNS